MKGLLLLVCCVDLSVSVLFRCRLNWLMVVLRLFSVVLRFRLEMCCLLWFFLMRLMKLILFDVVWCMRLLYLVRLLRMMLMFSVLIRWFFLMF